MKFINLTGSDSDKSIRVNFANVAFYQWTTNDNTLIVFIGGSSNGRISKRVKETPEEIDELLKG